MVFIILKYYFLLKQEFVEQILDEDLLFDNMKHCKKKLKDVYANYNKYEQLFAKIKATKEDYSIEKMSKKYLEAYKSLLK